MTLRYLIDTDWIIHYLNGHPDIVSRLNTLRDEGCAVSVVSLAELYEGVYNSSNPAGNETALNDFLCGVTVVGIDDETCKIFGRQRGRLRVAGKMIGDFDLLIGSTGLRHGLTVLTNNRRHFTSIDGLLIESR
jgi:tRNA(fMet)-specific endonuclease VapC